LSSSIGDVGEIGILGFSQRRRHADVDDVHRAELLHVGGGAQTAAFHHLGEMRARHVWNVAGARVDLRGLLFVDVEAGDVEPLLRELDRKRQADVAEPDDADPRLFPANPLENLLV